MPRSSDERSRVEAAFVQGRLSRGQFVAALTALGVTASSLELLLGAAPLPARADAETARYLVLIVMDGFRPDYRDLAPMPTLDALTRAGIVYDRAWVGQLESETPASHATLATGSMPKNHRIIGFEWRNPKTGREVFDGWPPGVRAGLLEQDLRDAGVNSIPAAIKAVDPKAKVVALSSEKVYAAGAMGGWAADYILFHQRTAQSRNVLTPAGLHAHTPPPEFLTQPGLQQRWPLGHFTDWDYLSTMLARSTVQMFRPRALMINLPGPDYYGHTYGGPASPAVMAQIVAGLDRNIGRIVAAYKAAGMYDQAIFVVTADHGMVPNTRSVDGETTKSIVRQVGGQYLFHTGGTAADIYLRNPLAARSVAGGMLKLPGVAAAYYRPVTSEPVEYVRHERNHIDPALDAAYQYLLDTFTGPTAPDVVAPFYENTVGRAKTSAYGDHGGLNWGAQHVPMVIAGPGVRVGALSHAPARLMDVAPTVLRLLGVPGLGMDGIVLADALVAATPAELSAQASLNVRLAAYQDALIAQSQATVADDAKNHRAPPPPLPAHP